MPNDEVEYNLFYNESEGKYTVSVGDNYSGPFDTEKEARDFLDMTYKMQPPEVHDDTPASDLLTDLGVKFVCGDLKVGADSLVTVKPDPREFPKCFSDMSDGTHPVMENPCLDSPPPWEGLASSQFDNLEFVKPVKSDGGSSSYYTFEMWVEHYGIPLRIMAETQDIIKHMVGNDFDLGNIIKASRRIHLTYSGGGKAGTTALYDWNKILYTAQKNINWLEGRDEERNR